MLGIPLSAPGGDLSKWFIPTYVGHTWADLLKFMSRTVHPHIRGAYCNPLSANGLRCGSSPPTWGIQGQLMYFVRRFRFIPTYVGHTRCAKRRWPGGPVHPHIRGAYVDMMHQISRHGGSSPHTWGIPAPPPGIYATPRFIPTYVGHTAHSFQSSSGTSVHPHIRGAYVQLTFYSDFLAGSSPHTWGILNG